MGCWKGTTMSLTGEYPRRLIFLCLCAVARGIGKTSWTALNRAALRPCAPPTSIISPNQALKARNNILKMLGLMHEYKKIMDELSTLNIVIKNAGRVTMRYYGNDLGVRYKAHDHSPVTRADIESQKMLFDGLSSFGYAFLSEEDADNLVRLQSQRVWIIDTLDGTSSFLDRLG